MGTAKKEWTEGRRRSFITSTLRGGYRRWPPKYECLKAAHAGKKINEKSGRMSAHYTCAKCKEDFATSFVQVDHIKPIVDPKIGFTTWDDFIDNLMCPIENLQVLCKTCHSIKTKKENEERKKYANSKKDTKD